MLTNASFMSSHSPFLLIPIQSNVRVHVFNEHNESKVKHLSHHNKYCFSICPLKFKWLLHSNYIDLYLQAIFITPLQQN